MKELPVEEKSKIEHHISKSTTYENDIHYSNDCAGCMRDSCEDCYPY